MRIGLFFFLSLCFVSCTPLKQTLQKISTITISYSNSVTIPKTDSLLNGYQLVVQDIPTDIQSYANQHQTNVAWIEDIRVGDITVYIDSPLTQQFDPLQEVHVFISVPGEPEVEVAWADSIGDDVEQAIELDLSGINLKPYLTQSHFNTRIEITTDQVIAKATKLRCDMKFSVQANLPGE